MVEQGKRVAKALADVTISLKGRVGLANEALGKVPINERHYFYRL